MSNHIIKEVRIFLDDKSFEKKALLKTISQFSMPANVYYCKRKKEALIRYFAQFMDNEDLIFIEPDGALFCYDFVGTYMLTS